MDVYEPSRETRSRPYRSHKIPACNLCRKRKIRCEINATDHSCRMCQERQVKCEFSTTTHQARDRVLSKAQTDGHLSVGDAIQPAKPNASGTHHHTSPEECDTLPANPTMAEDLNILEAYITSRPGATTLAKRPYNRISKSANDSVMYLPVPKRRQKLSVRKDPPGRVQRDVMDEVLGPLKEEVVKLYILVFHLPPSPCC
jgi:hypothetical protein